MVKKLVTFFLLLLFASPIIGQTAWDYDYLKGSIVIDIDPFKEEIEGRVKYKLSSVKPVDSIYLDARDMEFETVRFNGKQINFEYDGSKLVIMKALKPGKTYRLDITYRAKPKQTVYFLGWKDRIVGNEQIWTQGQGKYTSHWVPSPDEMREKVIFDLAIRFDHRYEVIANGNLRKTIIEKDKKLWKYRMVSPMSSYLLAFAIGDYSYTESRSRSDIPIHLYISREDQACSEPTYRFSEKIFNFLESEIGVPYPWQNYKQVPVRDFLYAGMENTGLTIYSDGYVIDSTAFRDLNYVNVNAHELAHQWFGNLVTETDAAQHWLHEGLATYYAYLSEREIFGEDYFFWKLWDTAQQLKEQADGEEGEALSDPGAGSLTFYEKGAWAAFMLNEEIGKNTFRNGIQEFLGKYAFKNATLSQFFEVMEDNCECSLDAFYSSWFDSESFPYGQCEDMLVNKSPSIRTFKELQQELISSPDDNESIIQKYWDKINDPELKGRIISRYTKSLSPSFLNDVVKEDLFEVNQAISVNLPVVTPEMQLVFESFLGDPSYITRENALYKLWVSFPDKRKQYLEPNSDIMGLPNRSFRLTWLLLALLTPDYGTPEDKAEWQSELRGYTASHYSFEVRQNAFVVIRDIFGLNEHNLKDLAEALVHHVWQFRNFARNLMEELLSDQVYRVRIRAMLDQLRPKVQAYLKTSLAE